MCGKEPYSKREAQEVVNRRTRGRRQNRHGRPEFLRIYQCPECNLWHVTHKRRPPE